MQLVLCNNRVVAHGENFLSLGGVVINTETGAKYENATIAECECCPSDINEVGYEYHAGVFVPCAPYGKGNNNGYFMEVCETCATPRSSGLPIKDIKWSKVASVTCFIQNATYTRIESFDLPVSPSVLAEYSMLRYKIKAGSYFDCATIRISQNQNPVTVDPLISVNGYLLYTHTPYQGLVNGYGELFATKTIVFDKDVVIPFYVVNKGCRDLKNGNYDGNDTSSVIPLTDTISLKSYTLTGEEIDPLNISVAALNPKGSGYSNTCVVIELEGRK